MFKVQVQDFNGNWDTAEFETKDEVFHFIASSDMANAIEIEDVEFEGKVPTVSELENWLKS